MSIKSILVLVAAIALGPAGYAQYFSIVLPYQTNSTSTNIVVPAGRVIEIVNFNAYGQAPPSLSVDGVPIGAGFKMAGPATLTLRLGAPMSSAAACTYRLFDNTSGIGEGLPSTAVVIPADATGPVQIILESSNDLVTWTPASPGSYGASTSKRFFRLRAVHQ